MYNSRKSKSGSRQFPDFRDTSSGSYLQRDLESLIISLENEKRESTYLEEQIKLTQYEITSIPKSRSFFNLKNSISVLEKKLELETNQLNQLKYKNKLLRDQINDHRLEKSSHKQSLDQIKDHLVKTSKAAEEQYDKINRTDEEQSTQNDKIGLIRSKSATQNSKFEEQISTLASCLKNNREQSKLVYDDRNYSIQGVEIISSLKNVMKKFNGLTVQKKETVDQYLKFLGKLKGGFDEIKRATGLSNVEDIVTSCIKSEEQNETVLLYLNNLNSEIDILLDSLNRTKEKISFISSSKQQGSKKLEDYLNNDKAQLDSLQKKILEKTEDNKKCQTSIQSTLPLLSQTYKTLKKADFTLPEDLNLEIDSIEKLNSENIRIILAGIEEMSNSLATCGNFKKPETFLKPSKKSSKRFRVNEVIEEAEFYEDPELDEIKVPITIQELRHRAEEITKKRRSFVRGKSSNPDSRLAFAFRD